MNIQVICTKSINSFFTSGKSYEVIGNKITSDSLPLFIEPTNELFETDVFLFYGCEFRMIKSLTPDRIQEAYNLLFKEEPFLGKEEKALRILNTYRNYFYKEGNCERGIIAQAINELLPRYCHLKESIINNDLK